MNLICGLITPQHQGGDKRLLGVDGCVLHAGWKAAPPETAERCSHLELGRNRTGTGCRKPASLSTSRCVLIRDDPEGWKSLNQRCH